MSKIIEKNTFKWYNIPIKIQEEKYGTNGSCLMAQLNLCRI